MSPEQQGSGPSGSRDRMTLVGPVVSPVTSLPCTPGRDILLPGDAEESLRTKKGRVAAATLEQEMGRRSVAVAIRPIKDRAVASSSSTTEHLEPEGMNEILRDIPPRRGVLPIPGPARGSPRVDETFPERDGEASARQPQ